MHAFARIVAGDPSGRAELEAALLRAHVTYGVDVPVLERLGRELQDGDFACEATAIAVGSPMQRESSGACDLAIAVGLQPGHRLADGSFDYRDRGLLTSVKRGQVVANCQPAVVGVDGRTVTDRVIPFEKVPATGNPSFGSGLVRDRSGAVVAERDGVVRRGDGAVLDIGDHHEHQGDVDLRSGHLDMLGSLAVTGDVTAKFEVQASGDVQIEKSVARGVVYSGGNVAIRGGVIGAGGTTISAEGDVEAEHAQSAGIRCGGALHLRKSAVNCDLHAQRVRIDGSVRGGAVHAEHEVVVVDAGARVGGETVLAVGIELSRPLKPRFDQERVGRHMAERLGAQVVHGRRGEPARGEPDDDSTEEAARVQRLRELASGAHIDVLGTAHAGTTIAIGPHRLVLDEPRRHLRFRLDPDSHEIRSDPLA